jgi:hypothetical protein
MTIGPEPMTRTDWISVRLGTEIGPVGPSAGIGPALERVAEKLCDETDRDDQQQVGEGEEYGEERAAQYIHE